LNLNGRVRASDEGQNQSRPYTPIKGAPSFFEVVGNDNSHDDGHYCKNDQGEDEADPSLLASSTGRYDSLLGVSETNK